MDTDPAVDSTLLLIFLVLLVLISVTEQYFLSINPGKIETAAKQGDRLAITLQKILGNKRVLLGDSIWVSKILMLSCVAVMLTLTFGSQLFSFVILSIILAAALSIFPRIIQIWIKKLRLGHLFYVFQIVHYYVFFLPTFFTLSLLRKSMNLKGNPFAEVLLLLPFHPNVTQKKSGDFEIDDEPEVVLLKNALDFSNVKVRDCMIPRTEMVSLSIDSSIEILKEKFIETHFSKLLIFSGESENIQGYVHSHDLFKKPSNIKSILLPVFVVPETMNAQELFALFVKEKRSIAVVLDEFGGTAGMVTIEDVIEEIFGEIDDEHDTNAHHEEQLSGEEFLFSGRLEIDYLNSKYGLSIPESDNYDTIAGFVLDQLEEIPQANACLETDQFLITVQKVSDTRIELIQLKVKDEN